MWHTLTTVCLHMNQKANMACHFKTERLLKVKGSHVHRKSGNIWEILQDRDIVSVTTV